MTRRRWGLVIALVAAAVAVPLAAAEPSRSQRFFADRLLADARTPDRIKTLLRGGGFVEKSIAFRDLTGDEKDDAVVRVHSGGAPGVVAVYVFSTDTGAGGSELKPVFRSERLVRASTALDHDDTLTYRYARYAPGDELCCPAQIGEARLGWDESRKRLRVTERRTLAGPNRPR